MDKDKWQWFLMLLVVSFLFGCATNQILVDGMPMPNTTYQARSSTKQIRVEAYAAQMVWRRDGPNDEKYLYPAKYLDFNKEEVYYLPADTAYIATKVRIVNPLRKEWQLWEKYIIQYDDVEYPYEISHKIYQGKSHQKVFNLRRKVEPTYPKVSFSIVIKTDKDDNLDMFNPKLKYQIRPRR